MVDREQVFDPECRPLRPQGPRRGAEDEPIPRPGAL